MATSQTSLIVDKHGKPFTFIPYYANTRKLYSQNYTERRFWGNYDQSQYQFINPFERRMINQFALDLYRSSPIVNAAITRKNEWAAATCWYPIFMGDDSDWGELATEFLCEVGYQNCSVTNRNMDLNRMLLTIGIQMDIAGDLLILKTPTRDGLGRFALYPSNMVGQRDYGSNIVQDGRYKGASIDDGVISNSSNSEIAYRVLQADEEDDSDYSTRDAILASEPTDLCVRGFGLLTAPLLTLLSAEETATAINRTVFNDSKTGLLVSTDTGTGEDYVMENPIAADLNSNQNPNVTKFQPSIIELGDVTFLNAKSGEKVETLNSERPHMNGQAWLESQIETSIYSLGWAYALLSPGKLSGPNVRMIEAQVQQTIAVRQKTLKNIVKQFTLYSLSTAIENGDLPEPKGDDWRMWDWRMPPKFIIDSYYADQIALQKWNAGCETLAGITREDWMETRGQRQIENLDGIARAKILVTASSGSLSFERALTMVGIGPTPQVLPIAEQDNKSPVT